MRLSARENLGLNTWFVFEVEDADTEVLRYEEERRER
jgi:hypothetical protein